MNSICISSSSDVPTMDLKPPRKHSTKICVASFKMHEAGHAAHIWQTSFSEVPCSLKNVHQLQYFMLRVAKYVPRLPCGRCSLEGQVCNLSGRESNTVRCYSR
jgi:hypothetical protein